MQLTNHARKFIYDFNNKSTNDMLDSLNQLLDNSVTIDIEKDLPILEGYEPGFFKSETVKNIYTGKEYRIITNPLESFYDPLNINEMYDSLIYMNEEEKEYIINILSTLPAYESSVFRKNIVIDFLNPLEQIKCGRTKLLDSELNLEIDDNKMHTIKIIRLAHNSKFKKEAIKTHNKLVEKYRIHHV